MILHHLFWAHHPKFTASRVNKCSLVIHIIGGTIAILGLYFGMLFNSKFTCALAIGAAALLHVPTTIFQTRQVHGSRQFQVPAYVAMTYFFLEKYIDFYLYDGSIDTVFSAAMALQVFGMVRWWSIVTQWAGMKNNLDHAVMFAGLANCAFFGGAWYPIFLLSFLYTWNIWFRILNPVPVEQIRVHRVRYDFLSEKQKKEFE